MIVSSLGPVRYVLFLKRPHHLSSQRVSWTVWMTDGMEAFIQSIHSTVKHGCNVLQVINYNNRWLRCQMYRMSSLITKSRLMPLRWRAAGKIKSQFAQGTKIKNKRGTERMPPTPTPKRMWKLKKRIQYLQFLSQIVWNNYKPGNRGELDFFKAIFFYSSGCHSLWLLWVFNQFTQDRNKLSGAGGEDAAAAAVNERILKSELNQTCLMSWRHIIHWGIFNQANKMSLVCFFSRQIPMDQQPCLTSRSPHSETDTDWENICTLFTVAQPSPHAISWKQGGSHFHFLSEIAASNWGCICCWDKFAATWW